MTALDCLRKYWKYDAFKPPQDQIIQSVLEGHHTMALLPTGGGKSICYQIPGLMLDGVCLVVSPLIALMRDQVENLQKRGIKASALYAGMSHREIDITLDNCIYGDIKFLYVSPERLDTALFKKRADRINISLLAVDEAHCISQWGHDFRPAYLEIKTFAEAFQIKKIMALTATATIAVQKDIIRYLDLVDVRQFQKSFARENLHHYALKRENKEQRLVGFLNKIQGCSIVYVRTRKKAKILSGFLQQSGIHSAHYHAGLSSKERAKRQEDWLNNKLRLLVATNAFGMGIDKPDVRSVVHMDIPESLEAYYQEVGRAGRDGKKAYTLVFYNEMDKHLLLESVKKSHPPLAEIRTVYQALCNHFKLAIGSRPVNPLSFDIGLFSENFDLPPVLVFSALGKLKTAGLIQLNEDFKGTSRLTSLLNREQLYSYQLSNSKLDPLITAFLRLYGGGLFNSYINIKEQEIAKLLHQDISQVVAALMFLSQSKVIDYLPKKEGQFITFTRPRIPIEELRNFKDIFDDRRNNALDKAKAIIGYLEEARICKTRQLQQYFGEQSTENCGNCDFCNRSALKQTIPKKDLVAHLTKHGAQTISQLTAAFHMEEEVLIPIIREMIEDKICEVNLDLLYLTNR